MASLSTSPDDCGSGTGYRLFDAAECIELRRARHDVGKCGRVDVAETFSGSPPRGLGAEIEGTGTPAQSRDNQDQHRFAAGRQSGPDIALASVRPTADDEFVAITKRHPDCR